MKSTNQKLGDYEVHPAAMLFRLLEGEQFAKLAKDVKARGELLEPVALLDGKLLDGRNRVRACLKAGVEITTVNLPPDTDPVAYVISKNIHRRHLTPNERVALLKKIPKELVEKAKAEAKAAKAAGQKRGGRGKKTQGSAEPRVSTAKAKGNIVGLSASTVKKFETVEKRDPELAKQVEEGKTTVRAAHQKVKKSAKGKKPKLTLVDTPDAPERQDPEPDVPEEDGAQGGDTKTFAAWEQAHQYLNAFVSYVDKLQEFGEPVADLVVGLRGLQKQFAKLRKASTEAVEA